MFIRTVWYLSGLLALGLLSSSCSFFEHGQTTLAGSVVDSVTGQGVGQAQVAVFANPRGGFYSTFTQVGNWRDTDAQGRFAFAFEAESGTDYVIRASSRRGETPYLSAPFVKAGRRNKSLRVPVLAHAWVAIHLRDEGVRSDAVNINVWGFAQSITIRPPLDTLLYWPVPAGDKNVVGWQLNGSRTVSDTQTRIPFTVAGMDTARFDIRY
ncbi:hypothetical protein [Hymenobacter sublimis]|uniref:Carboxypeptidase regulatory-like domain-containing protein n=1 Tax=Hymenobacter sublimis TaxID=2933777 RepID=A0ABY4J564_9BACT|nr:hypothetical protein [Hymenobacter sublimis]UPL47979.1 hypothetical protein MWH26_12345 [Hymenobacter sublimis]